MIVEFKKFYELSTGAVDFYSVLLNENELTEFEKFDAKSFPKHEREVTIIYDILKVIKKSKARNYYFKEEKSAHAIPIVPRSIMDANKNDFGIRLYCIYLNDNLVILLNGDIKTKKDPTACINVKDHFKRAWLIADKIDKMLADGGLNLNNRSCLDDIIFDI